MIEKRLYPGLPRMEIGMEFRWIVNGHYANAQVVFQVI